MEVQHCITCGYTEAAHLELPSWPYIDCPVGCKQRTCTHAPWDEDPGAYPCAKFTATLDELASYVETLPVS